MGRPLAAKLLLNAISVDAMVNRIAVNVHPKVYCKPKAVE